MFFPGSWFPHKFVPCFSQKVGFPVSSCRVTMPSPVSDIDLQMKLEADSVHDGLRSSSPILLRSIIFLKAVPEITDKIGHFVGGVLGARVHISSLKWLSHL